MYSKQKKKKKKFDTYTAAMMNSAKKAEKIEDLRKYVLGNWSAVRRTLHNKLVNDVVQKAMSVMYCQTVLVPDQWAGVRPEQTG